MRKRVLIIALSLALVLITGTSCDLLEQYNEMQSQNQLNTYTTTSSDSDSKTPTEDSTNADSSENKDDIKEEAPPPQRTEPKAPDFIVYDANGKEVKLSDYLGKPVVLNFWASWCGPCQSEMPAFHQKYLEYGSEIQFLMVNLTGGRETISSANDFISKNGYTFPVFFDTAYSASNAFSVYSIPATYFIDADGYIVANAIGAINANVLQQGIDMIK